MVLGKNRSTKRASAYFTSHSNRNRQPLNKWKGVGPNQPSSGQPRSTTTPSAQEHLSHTCEACGPSQGTNETRLSIQHNGSETPVSTQNDTSKQVSNPSGPESEIVKFDHDHIGDNPADNVEASTRRNASLKNRIYSSAHRRRATRKSSRFFASTTSPATSCLRFPSREAETFGLIQERFVDDAFCLLTAVIFLHQTKGAVAVPILLSFIEVFGSPELLSAATPEDIVPFIRHLGLQNRRAETLVGFAKAWVRNPPTKNRRYRLLHYPHPGAGSDVSRHEEPLHDADRRYAWEIAHLPGIGPYALDSWRIFCRDSLRGRLSESQANKAPNGGEVQDTADPEWMHVIPSDKELRVYLQWRWIQLGWLWDPLTGRRVKVETDVLESLEKVEISQYGGFVNPWLKSYGLPMPQEQILGGTQ